MKVIFASLVLVSIIQLVTSLECPGNCDEMNCPRLENCKGGLTFETCGCCKICAKTEWESCGNYISAAEGFCDAGLTCVLRNFPKSRCERASCAKKRCGLRQLCELNRQGKPVCVCPRHCKTYKWRQTPVCGKNGKQYSGPCDLYRHECILGREIGIMRPGLCKKCYFNGKLYKYGDARRGAVPCRKCVCHHGHWRCKTKRHCMDHLKTCTVFRNPNGGLSSTCPQGYWCKVQIPGIPDQGIPEVGVCVMSRITDAKSSTIIPTSPYNVTVTGLRKQKPGTVLIAACQLPPKSGPCRAFIPRWYYNRNRRKCMRFTFGGCSGNANNFRTKSNCRNTCMRRKPPQIRVTSAPRPTTASLSWDVICKLAPVAGPCRAAMPQWYYNPKKRRCARFIYGGCGGNKNNFDTKDECKAACMRREGKDRWVLKVTWWENYQKMMVETKSKRSFRKKKRARARSRSKARKERKHRRDKSQPRLTPPGSI